MSPNLLWQMLQWLALASQSAFTMTLAVEVEAKDAEGGRKDCPVCPLKLVVLPPWPPPKLGDCDCPPKLKDTGSRAIRTAPNHAVLVKRN
mmetsp:Transcript_124504/g.220611  ORF Transcript_124504/g.220611 Transcript_124504/m.220611 type:complete len:90 (-) Transcript_124504:7-276(-)